MDIDEGLTALKKFNEKAEKLRRLTFTDIILKKLNKVIIDYSGKRGLIIKRKGANEEQIDAFLFTLRFFYNKRDGCSFGAIRDFYNTLPIPKDKRDLLNSLLDGLDQFMNSKALMAFEGQGYTRKEIFDTFMWGELAHETDDKLVEQYNRWMKNKLNGYLFESEFIFILSGILMNIFAIEELNKEVIAYLEEN